MHKAVGAVFEQVLRTGDLEPVADCLTTIEDFSDFIGLDEAMERQRRFGT